MDKRRWTSGDGSASSLAPLTLNPSSDNNDEVVLRTVLLSDEPCRALF